MKIVMTLVMVYDDQKILLGLKKRRFGVGRWYGFGGKVEGDETIEEVVRRELMEEVCISPKDLTPRGQLIFTFEENDDELEVHLFSVHEFSGEPQETEEMKPQWFLHSEIPYEQMWSDDPYWIPQFLAGKNIKGKVHFDSPESQRILTNSIEAYD